MVTICIWSGVAAGGFGIGAPSGPTTTTISGIHERYTSGRVIWPTRVW